MVRDPQREGKCEGFEEGTGLTVPANVLTFFREDPVAQDSPTALLMCKFEHRIFITVLFKQQKPGNNRNIPPVRLGETWTIQCSRGNETALYAPMHNHQPHSF